MMLKRSGAGEGPRSRIPAHASVLSVVCLGIPIAASALWGGELGQYELLLWVTALLPPFLLAYHRGWFGAAVALAAGMASLSVVHAGLVWSSSATALSWSIPVVVSVLLILVSLGAGWLREALGKRVLLAERNAAELSLVVDASSRVHYASPSAERLVGVPAAELKGRSLSELLDDGDDTATLDGLLRQGSEGAPVELRLRHGRGGVRVFELAAGGEPRTGRRDLIVLVARDVTARRSAEEQQRRVHTMRVVSRIVGGVAHDTNNLVTALNGHIHALQDTLPPSELRRLEVEALKQRGERVGALVRQLVGFTRQSDLRTQAVFLNGFVQQRMTLLQSLLPDGVQLSVVLDDDGGFLSIDPVGLTEAITSVISNAAEATQRGDEVTIRTYRDTIAESRTVVYDYPVRTGDYLVIEVADTGRGMPADVLCRAMEPFFTTRQSASSLGLGLSAAYGFIKQSGGYIWLSSQPGEGTTVKIYLPEERVEQAPDIEPPRLPSPPSSHRFRTVLAVDDDPLVLSYMRSVLLREGYIVLEAGDGREAVEQFGNASIDVLVSGLGLPNLRGDELLRYFRRNRPLLPALLTSAAMHSEALDPCLLEAPTELLDKPFSPPELLAALERVQERAACTEVVPV